MSGQRFTVAVAVVCAGVVLQVGSAAARAADAPTLLQRDKVVVVRRDGEPAVIDELVSQTNVPATVKTRAALWWTADALHVDFHCDDAEVTNRRRDRDAGDAWKDDGVEVFLDIGHGHDIDAKWFHVLVTASGVIYDERDKRLDFNAADLKTTVARTDTGWSASLVIPWSDIGAKPEPGDAWGLNLNRTDQPRGEYLCWSPTYGLFHKIDQWGHIVFVGNDAARQAAQEQQGRKQIMTQHKAIEEKLARKMDYVDRVTRGEGFVPWQKHEHVSDAERDFRQMIEDRKTALLANRTPLKHPVMITPKQIERAKRNIESADWAREWFDEAREVADHIVAQDDGYIDSMISELTPTNPYGITCPNCVGRLSQEGSLAYGGIKWDYKQPDHMTCEACGQTLPDAKYPETGKLALPRSGQTLTHFLTPAEKAHPDDRSGKYAWKWYGTPIHVSFDGIIREKKDAFMIGATRKLAVVYALTGDARYAAKAIAILERLAHCYRNWLYHDYFDGYADCDPMWAAWHAEEKGLFPLEWKRCAVAAHYEKDDVDSASMLSNYWGSGRLHPSCDSIANLVGLCTAYDLVHDAVDAEGRPLWTDAARAQVERDLLLEYMMGAEAWLGGHLEAKAGSNKAGRAYCSVAAIGKTLGLPDYADTALRGYELLRDVAFISDGFSRESPFYTFDGFMSPLVRVPEILDGYAWPDGYEKRSGVVRVFDTDPKLRLIFRAMLESQRPDGRHIPLSDTREPRGPNMNMVEVALHHYPDLYRGRFLMLRRDRDPGEFSLFNNDADTMAAHVDTPLPEILFPDWKAAILRHGSGPDAACLALAFNDAGVHMHNDSLNLFYAGGGHTILGDQGYISDAPTIHWGHSTMSHNLVIVDGEEQPQKDRRPSLRMMATSPMASFVEAESFVYEQCSAYRRLVVMVKGPDGHTFAVDVFRVRGGRSHDWRAYSEIASNIAQGTARTFEGIDMPDEPDVPNFGGSVEREHLFGLRDVVTAKNASGGWHATWQQADRAYRLHMLTDAAKVQASNGPGQRDESETGRRVRYLDVIREGSDLSSTFIAVHEPSVGKSTMPIRKVVLLGVPDGAGENAVALRVESDWGTYLLLSEFDNEATVDRVRFKGTLGLVRTHEDGSRDMLSYRSSTLIVGGIGFEDQPASWTGTVKQQTDNRIETSSPRPANWPDTPRDLRVWVRVGDGKVFTGYPVANTYADAITVERFPLLPVTQVELPAVQYMPADTE